MTPFCIFSITLIGFSVLVTIASFATIIVSSDPNEVKRGVVTLFLSLASICLILSMSSVSH